MRKSFSILCFVFFLFSAAVSAEPEPPITAKAGRKKVATGELFTYAIKINGSFASPKLTLPDFSGFEVVSTNQAKSYSFQGSSTKVTVSINYVLMAVKPGSFAIGEAVLQDGGKKFSTAPVSIEVTGKPLEEKRRLAPYVESGTEI